LEHFGDNEMFVEKCITKAVAEVISWFIFRRLGLKVANWGRGWEGKVCLELG